MSTGVRGELLAAEKLVEHGWSVALPVDAPTFDIICVKGKLNRRIQVKTTEGLKNYEGRSPHYQFQLGRGLHSKFRYSKGEFDFFVCVALDTPRFWVFPFDDISTLTMKIYDATARYSRYENAWQLLERE